MVVFEGGPDAMGLSGHGVFIVQGELGAVLAILRRSHRWPPHQPQLLDEQDPMTRNFADLREVLNTVKDLNDMSPNTFLDPFLDVIRSDQTSGPVTGQALASVGKFLNYGLIDPHSRSAASAVENLADAVTHARFLATDTGSDEVVLLKILSVLRTLMLSPVGALLANESVCEIMQSCFRICFETRLTELLRKAAEATLADMIQLLFTRLPTFEEDLSHPYIRKLKMRANLFDPNRVRRRKKYKGKGKKAEEVPTAEDTGPETDSRPSPQPPLPDEEAKATETPASEGEAAVVTSDAPSPVQSPDEEEKPLVLDLHGHHLGMQSDEEVQSPLSAENSSAALADVAAAAEATEKLPEAPKEPTTSDEDDEEPTLDASARRNERGVRFTVDMSETAAASEARTPSSTSHIPYGLPCVRELFRFLISLTNPLDSANTEQMMQMGLGLLTVALEAGADALGRYSLLLPLVRNELSRALFLLLGTDKLGLFSSALRVCFLLFEALRTHLKFQLEGYLTKLMGLVVSESARVGFEQKEMALEALVSLWRIPGLVTELHLNYDCDLYCSNLFEDITKLLSKNAFPVTGLYSTHILSLDALLTVVDSIEGHCHCRMMTTASATKEPSVLSGEMDKENMSSQRRNRMPVSKLIPSHEDLIAQKKKKKLLTTGSEMFNQGPSKGIGFLQEHGLLQTPLVPEEVVAWLRENPRLDKKKIAEYICSRKNSPILAAFVKQFNFEGVRIDDALRMFLEAFRLPGEAAEISMVIEHFADHWHTTNDEPFANTDAAFTLSYAVIMLNVDQWNTNAKKQQVPMTVNQFCRNTSGVNGGGDFDREMLEDIYHSIRGEEIVMPAEQTGLVRENYEWKVLLRRGATSDGDFTHAPSGLYDHDLFGLIWGPTIAALSFVFDYSTDDAILTKAMSGFRKCAAISAHYGLSDVFDNLIISLCKFSCLMTAGGESPETLPVAFGAAPKSQLAARVFFELVHNHGDILREGWKTLLEVLLQLHRARLLPKSLTEVEDFVDPKGWVSIVREAPKMVQVRSESGLLSSLVSILGGSGSDSTHNRGPTPEEQEFIKAARMTIVECHPEQLVTDSKYLTSEAVGELLKALVVSSAHPDDGAKLTLSPAEETRVVFYLELLISVTLENRDRLHPFWKTIRAHMYSLLSDYRKNSFLVERGVVGMLRLATRLLFREEIADEVLQSLGLLQLLRPATFRRLSQEIAAGLHELLRSNAANIHSRQHWAILFGLLEAAGAAAFPDAVTRRSQRHASRSLGELRTAEDADEEDDEDDDEHERGYTSDSELYAAPSSRLGAAQSHGGSGEWLVVQAEGGDSATAKELSIKPTPNNFSILLRTGLKRHDPKAFLKACESLAFLVRDAAHITPDNLESCISCIRTFVEASLDGGRYAVIQQEPKSGSEAAAGKRKVGMRKKTPDVHAHAKARDGADSASESESVSLADSYHQISHQLLDLAHTLHVKSAAILAPESPEPSRLWNTAWRPLLQAMARLCCDCRRQLRTTALNYLQRAFLIHDLQTLLTPEHWEDCFTAVLFPLLAALLDNLSPMDPLGMEETRVRTMALLCKVFLQHLAPLSALSTFAALWMTVLDFCERYLHTERSDLLSEAIPESLKNMLLVMETTHLFNSKPGLYTLTADRLATFLPDLMEEILPKPPSEPTPTPAPLPSPPAQEPGQEPPHAPPIFAPEIPLEEVVVHQHAAHPPVPTPTRGLGALATSQLPQTGIILHPPAAQAQSTSQSPPPAP